MVPQSRRYQQSHCEQEANLPTTAHWETWHRGALCVTSKLVCAVAFFQELQSVIDQKCKVSIKKILNLNDPVESSETDDSHSSSFLAPTAPILKDGRPIWKVLIFDVRIAQQQWHLR